MDSDSCFSDIISGNLMIMTRQSFDVDSMWHGFHQHKAILEINSGAAHQFAGDKVIRIQDADIQPIVFLHQGVVARLKWRFQQFRRMNPLSLEEIVPENIPFGVATRFR